MRRGEACFQSISRLRRMRVANDLAALVLFAAGLALATVTVIATLFWSAWVLLVLLLPFGYLVWTWLAGLSTKRLAGRIEECFPEVKGKLVPALELAEWGLGTQSQLRGRNWVMSRGWEGYSLELIDAAISDVEAKVTGLPLGRVVDRRRVLWGGVALAIGLVLFLGYRGVFPARSRLGLLNAFAPAAVPVEFMVQPGDTALLPGGEVALRCQVRPAGVFRMIVFERLGKPQETRRIALGNDGGQVVVRPQHDFRYRFRVLSHNSQEHDVRIIEPLSLERLAFKYRYPEYSGLPEHQSSSTEITALKGTRIEVEGEANRSLEAGRIAFGADTVEFDIERDGTNGTDRTDGTGFRGSFVVRDDREGRIELCPAWDTIRIRRAEFGYVPRLGFQAVENVRVRAMPDESPLVRLFLPGRDVDLPMSMQVVLGVNSLDDFGLDGMYLYYSKDTAFERRRLKDLSGKREDTTFYTWDLSQLGLLPGEGMSYYVGVSDNDEVSGPKFSRTDVFKVRFPTMTEIYNASVQETQQTAEELGPMKETQEKLGEQLERIGQQLKQEGNLSWDERQALQQVLADQGQLAQQIEEMRNEVAGVMDDMFSGMQLDKETLERMGQLQELLSQLLPQELQQSLARLSEELNKQAPDLRKALSEFKLNQDQLKQGIDQALEFLKRVLEEQRLEAMARKAEDLAKTQEELLSKLGAEKPEMLSEFEKELGKGIDSLQKEMEDLARTMSDSATGDSLSSLAEGMNQDSLSELANQTGQAMQQNRNSQAKAQGQKLGQKLRSLGQSLSSMSQGLKKKRSNETARQLTLAAEELLNLSQRQEGLAQEISSQEEVSPKAGVQMGLHDGTRVVAESIAALGSRTMALSSKLVEELGRAMQSMQNAAQFMVENRPGQASQQMLAARTSVDQTVSWILTALEEQQQGGGMSGGMEGLMEQLSQMTADQMAINAGMGGIPMPIPGGGLTSAQMQALQRLMGMQQGLRERLQQMLESMGGQMPGLTSSLEGVLDEMKQAERDLSELNVSRELLQRQEGILSHLLDAQRSVRQRGFKDERQSEAAKPFETGPSPGLPQDAGERNRLLREELMRALKETQFSDYQQTIRAYFEQLLNQP